MNTSPKSSPPHKRRKNENTRIKDFLMKIGNNRYQVIDKIGSGGFGKVFLARPIVPGFAKDQYAIKLVPISSQRCRSIYENELHFSQTLKHKNIVTLVDHYTFTFQGEEFGVLVYERLSTDLLDYVLRKGSFLDDNEIKEIFREICKSVAYCHRNSVAHLDIKPDNFLVNFKPVDNDKIVMGSIQLCDFGFTRNCRNGMISMNPKSSLGTKEYKAPELAKQKKKKFGFLPHKVVFNGMKADMWSLGVTLFVLKTGFFPFLDNNYSKFDMSIISDVDCLDLITRLLDFNPENRPCINDVLNHPFLVEKKKEFDPMTHAICRVRSSSLNDNIPYCQPSLARKDTFSCMLQKVICSLKNTM